MAIDERRAKTRSRAKRATASALQPPSDPTPEGEVASPPAVRHVPPSLLLKYYERRGVLTSDVLDHIASCARCRTAAERLGGRLSLPPSPPEERGREAVAAHLPRHRLDEIAARPLGPMSQQESDHLDECADCCADAFGRPPVGVAMDEAIDEEIDEVLRLTASLRAAG